MASSLGPVAAGEPAPGSEAEPGPPVSPPPPPALQREPLYNWQATKASLKERFAFLFNSELLSDVRFVLGKGRGAAGGPQRIPAHRFVLAAGSAVFDAMFNGGMATTSAEIELPDVEPAAFLALLRCGRGRGKATARTLGGVGPARRTRARIPPRLWGLRFGCLRVTGRSGRGAAWHCRVLPTEPRPSSLVVESVQG